MGDYKVGDCIENTLNKQLLKIIEIYDLEGVKSARAVELFDNNYFKARRIYIIYFKDLDEFFIKKPLAQLLYTNNSNK